VASSSQRGPTPGPHINEVSTAQAYAARDRAAGTAQSHRSGVSGPVASFHAARAAATSSAASPTAAPARTTRDEHTPSHQRGEHHPHDVAEFHSPGR
jgi:hypothetical protein